MESEGEELCSERAALSCARAALDDLGGEIVSPDIELGGLTVVRPYPAPETREALTDDLEEGAPVDGVESILGIEGNVNPREGFSSSTARTECVVNSRPELQATPTWAGQGAPLGCAGGFEEPGGGG